MMGGAAGGTMAFGGSGSFQQNDSGSGNENTISDHGFGGAGIPDSTRSGGNHSNDGGSGSTMKKTSYKDKFKNFVKKHTSHGDNAKK